MTRPSQPVLRLVADEIEPVDGVDVDALLAEIEPLIERSAGRVDTRARGRWAAVCRLTDPGDLEHLAGHAASLRDAADTVGRQHTETAEDLGPLWDTWAGPAAEAVQDRVSALARSAHALVVELESTADRLDDAHRQVVTALEDLADELVEGADPSVACDRAAAACSAA